MFLLPSQKATPGQQAYASGFVPYWCLSIAGHRHSGILYVSQVLEHSSTRLGSLIPVPDWFRHRDFCSLRYQTDWMPDSPTFRHLKSCWWWWWKRDPVYDQTAGNGNWYTLHFHRQLLMVIFLLYDIKKSYVNARMPEKKVVRHWHFFRYSAPLVWHWQSGIRVQSGTAGHGLVQHWPAMYLSPQFQFSLSAAALGIYLSLWMWQALSRPPLWIFFTKSFIRSDVHTVHVVSE